MYHATREIVEANGTAAANSPGPPRRARSAPGTAAREDTPGTRHDDAAVSASLSIISGEFNAGCSGSVPKVPTSDPR